MIMGERVNNVAMSLKFQGLGFVCSMLGKGKT